MNDARVPNAVGCLLCLVQASESTRRAIFKSPTRTKIDAIVDTVDRLLDELVALARGLGPGSGSFEVGVLAYQGGADGAPRLRTVLPGTSSSRPFVPVSELAPVGPREAPDGPQRWVQVEPSGAAPARAALSRARILAADWAADHPGAARPLVVHLTDGESTDGPLDDVARAITEGRAAAFLVHCLFREKLPASAFTRAPETPSGDLWSMSSPLISDPRPGDDPALDERRALLVNKRSASRLIGDLIRRIWRAPANRADEAVRSAIAAPAPATPAPEPEPEALPDSHREPEAASEPPVPAGPPRFAARVLWTPKRGNTESQWEDGYAFAPEAGLVAVADGAGDGIFSKLWAELLLESYVAHPVALDDAGAVEAWIAERRRAWVARVDYPRQRWSIQLRLDQTCGAATFLGLEIGAGPEGPDDATSWTASAVGDVCLFHLRGGQLVDSFPVARAADFGTTPDIFQSKPMRPMPAGVVRRGILLPDDLLVIATDAVAQCLLAAVEAGNPPDWTRFWDLDQDAWRNEIETLRDQHTIVNDDCTLVVVRLPEAASQSADPASEPTAADEPGLPSQAAVDALDDSQPPPSSAVESGAENPLTIDPAKDRPADEPTSDGVADLN